MEGPGGQLHNLMSKIFAHILSLLKGAKNFSCQPSTTRGPIPHFNSGRNPPNPPLAIKRQKTPFSKLPKTFVLLPKTTMQPPGSTHQPISGTKRPKFELPRQVCLGADRLRRDRLQTTPWLIPCPASLPAFSPWAPSLASSCACKILATPRHYRCTNGHFHCPVSL